MIYDLKSPISIKNDPWEAYNDIDEHGSLQLSNIEFTTTTLCNMRCAHCAVGYTLQLRDPDTLPMDLILKRLDEVPHLKQSRLLVENQCSVKINSRNSRSFIKICTQKRYLHADEF